MIPLNMNCPEQVNTKVRKAYGWWPGVGGKQRVTANGYQVSFWGDENVKLDSGDGYTTSKYL